MLRSKTDTWESSEGDDGATGDILPPRTRRVACPRAGILFVHRSDPTVGPPGLQRVAPPRPHAGAVLARWCPLRPALGVHTRLSGGSSVGEPSARALPLHDPLSHAGRRGPSGVLRFGPEAAPSRPILCRSPRPSLWALRSPGPLGVAPGQGVGRRRPAPPRPRHLRRRRSPCGRSSHRGPPRSRWGLGVHQYGDRRRPSRRSAAAAADPGVRRHITVAFIDGDLDTTASQLGQWCLQHAGHSGTLEWAGPLDLLDRVNPIDTDSYDWFDRLTPQ